MLLGSCCTPPVERRHKLSISAASGKALQGQNKHSEAEDTDSAHLVSDIANEDDSDVEELHHCELAWQLCRHQCTPEAHAPASSPNTESLICGSIDVEGVRRSIHCVTTAAHILAKHKLRLERLKYNAQLGEEELETWTAQANRKSAQQALDLILELKGYYIKAAQTLCGAGQLPKEMEDAFAVLLDQCPKEDFEAVKSIVEAELGCSISDVFQDFDTEAVAAASIGQVHFATLKNGMRVAVKVQYPAVERFFRMDISMVSLAMRIVGMGEKVKKVFETMQDNFGQEFDYTKEAAIMREVAENILPHFGDKVVVPLPLDADHPCVVQQDLVKTFCTRKVLTMERLDGKPIKEYTKDLLKLFAEMYGTTAEELNRQMQIKDPSKIDTENKAIKAAMNMGEVSEGQSRMLNFAVRVRNVAAKFLGGCMCCCPEEKRPTWVNTQITEPVNGPKLARLLFDVHGHEMFQNGLFNSDPHAGNVFMMPDGKLGLLDYGACMRLDEGQRTNIAKMLVAIADEDDDAVPPAFHSCGFKSKKNDCRLALLLAHVFFNRGPFPYDMNRLAPKVGMPRDPDILTLDQYIRGGKLDEIEEFPGHLVLLQRCCMVLSGLGMELGAGRLSSAAMLKPQALKWLDQRKRPAK